MESAGLTNIPQMVEGVAIHLTHKPSSASSKTQSKKRPLLVSGIVVSKVHPSSTPVLRKDTSQKVCFLGQDLYTIENQARLSYRRLSAFMDVERTWHINLRELDAVFLSMKHFYNVGLLAGHHVLVCSHNACINGHINKKGGSGPSLQGVSPGEGDEDEPCLLPSVSWDWLQPLCDPQKD